MVCVGASRIKRSPSTKSRTLAVRRKLNDLSLALKMIRKSLDSDLYPDISKAASADEITAANLLRECSFDEAVSWVYKLDLRL
jgi:hypothetical protein